MTFPRSVVVVLLLLVAMAAPQIVGPATGLAEPGDNHAHPQGYQDRVEDIEEGLSPGDTGDGVEALQVYLEAFGYMHSGGYERRDFDSATETALKDFQRLFKLSVTGYVDRATLELLNTPRYDDRPDVAANGAPQVDDFVLYGASWDDPNLTYAYDDFTNDLSQAAQKSAMEQAFATWSAVTPLVFTEVALNQTPEIVIRFASGNHGDGYPFDGPSGTLAHAFYPPDTDPIGTSLHGDAHFDDAETWTVNIPVPGGGTDLVTVAIHEFGHSLGLGHSNNSNAIMAPYYVGANRSLHSDDIAGIQTLYGSGGGGGTIDAEIVSASASPTSITQNDGNVTITATVRNNGTSQVTIPITASGPNNWSNWTSRTLAPNASTTVQLNWPATIAGAHSFTVATSLNGDQNAGNNSKTTNSVTVTGQSGGTIFVSGVNMTATSNGTGYNLQAVISVGPNASSGSGALVYGYWISPQNQNQFAYGYANGGGQLTLSKTTTVTGLHKFQVSYMRKTGVQYNAAQNVGNPGSVNVGGGSQPVVDASVNAVNATPASLPLNSGNVNITATIGNNGDAGANVPVNITGPGGYSASQSVFVAAGSTAQASFSWPAGIAGNHSFSVTTTLAGDSNAGNNQRTSNSVSVTQSAVIDAEVVSLTRSTSSVEQNGPLVTFTANVRNNGTNSATFTVRLNSGSAGVNTTQSVTLGSGASQSVTFQWSPTVVGNHTFAATAQLANDANAGNNTKSTTVEVTQPTQGGAEVYVDYIRVYKVSSYTFVYTYIDSSDGQASAGATVTATLRAASGQTRQYTATTNSAGYAFMYVTPVGSGSHTFTVNDISLSGYTYNPALNGDTTVTVS